MIKKIIEQIQQRLGDSSSPPSQDEIDSLLQQLKELKSSEPQEILILKQLESLIEGFKKLQQTGNTRVNTSLDTLYNQIIEHPIYTLLYNKDEAIDKPVGSQSKKSHVEVVLSKIESGLKMNHSKYCDYKADSIVKQQQKIIDKLHEQTDLLIPSLERDDLNKALGQVEEKLSQITLSLSDFSKELNSLLLLPLDSLLLLPLEIKHLAKLKTLIEIKLHYFSRKLFKLPIPTEERDQINSIPGCDERLEYYGGQSSSLHSPWHFRGYFRKANGTFDTKDNEYIDKINYFKLWKKKEILSTQLRSLQQTSDTLFQEIVDNPKDSSKTLEEVSNELHMIFLQSDTYLEAKLSIQELIELSNEWNSLHHPSAQSSSSASASLGENLLKADFDELLDLQSLCHRYIEQFENQQKRKIQQQINNRKRGIMKQVNTIYKNLSQLADINSPSETTDTPQEIPIAASSSEITIQAPPSTSRLEQKYKEICKHRYFKMEYADWFKNLYEAFSKVECHDEVRSYKFLDDIEFELHSSDSNAPISTIQEYQTLCPDPKKGVQQLLSLKPVLQRSDNKTLTAKQEKIYKQLTPFFNELSQQKNSLQIRGFTKEARLVEEAEKIYRDTALYGEKQIWGENKNWSLLADPKFNCLKAPRGRLMQLWQQIETFIRNLFRKAICLSAHQHPQCFFSTRSSKLLTSTEGQIKSIDVMEHSVQPA